MVSSPDFIALIDWPMSFFVLSISSDNLRYTSDSSGSVVEFSDLALPIYIVTIIKKIKLVKNTIIDL
jgi:hypothetical protein